MKKILIVDDEADICLLLKKFFTKKGFEVEAVSDGEAAIRHLKAHETNLVICDFKLPDYTGLEILKKVKIINPKTQVIIITGYSDVKVAVEALKKGAYDYVTKPLYPDEILVTVQDALEQGTRKKEEKSNKAAGVSNMEFVIGPSQPSQTVQKHIDLIAPTDMSVIILGETGTGKEYVAKCIHNKSKRADQPFVAVDCGALPKELAGSELFGHVKGAFTGALNDKKGSFELANGGTLFLDEIGNLTYENQIKLLRVLQERVIKKVGGTKDIPVDIRILVATNENLKETIDTGEFREDIYHRLNEFRIELSPIRERTEDISHFAAHFLESSNQQLNKKVKGFDDDCMQILKNYYWHGNFRELRNVVKRSVLLCQSTHIDASCLPPEITDNAVAKEGSIEVSFHGPIPGTLREVAEEAEKRAILEVLERTNNNKSKTAQILDVDRKTLYNKLKAYNIEF
ncbi:MAG: sigma-54 dependent transcriptional regulator [Reichenbachiella sp.]|uniref:sigma-54-dependent transcriptional regulator n=1 Tax=Reichenbachiella sp. TaxID=2184521 RepID=UPI0032675FE7